MLQLINALSQTADLYTDTIIPIERNNPLFNDEDQLFADITYGFKLPLTPGNQEFIKNAHLVESANKQYAQQATLLVDGTPLHAGILTYKISGNNIDALFKINYGALSTKAKSVKLSEIYTGDAMANPYDASHMLRVCNNPKDHPYSFFPVYNEDWNESELETEFVINTWDHAAQKFVPRATCPFFKLKYLLQKAVEYLGFELDGDYLKDPESDEIFVYTRIMSSPFLNGCFTYMPHDLTLQDFLIRVKERFHIGCNFDMITGKVNIVTPNSALNNATVQDLADYVSSVDEIDVPEAKGYSIILMPDEEDELFLDPTAQQDNTYAPTNRLVIGNKEKEIEMESSTLKVKTFDTYSMPATKQSTYFFSNIAKPFPLRFLRYRGMKALAGGKVFPQAEPMELSLDDATWYKFKNESKAVKLKITIPAFLLARLKIYQKISFFSKEGNYTIALIDKLTYNLSSGNTGYITASLQCRTMVNSYSTTAQIIDYKPELDTEDEDSAGLIPTTYKAFFDQTRMSAVIIEIHTSSSRVNGRSSIRRESILTSTDRFGTGGMVISPPLVMAFKWELRVMTGVPRYAIVGGIKFNFTKVNDYYLLDLNTLPRIPYDIQGVWIIFDDTKIPGPDPISIAPPTDGGGGGVTPPVDPPTEPPVEPPVEEPEEPPVDEPEEPPVPLTLASKFSFPMGQIVPDNYNIQNETFMNIAKTDSDRLMPENIFKMHKIQPEIGRFEWAVAKAFLNYCLAANMTTGIHTLLWSNTLPSDVRAKLGEWTPAQFSNYIVNHIQTVMWELEPWWHIIKWVDVVNEFFRPTRMKDSTTPGDENYNFWLIAGVTDPIGLAFQAFNSIPHGIDGYINDYTIETSDAKPQTIVNYANELKSRGIRVDGISSQTHSPANVDFAKVETRFRKITSAGYKFRLSELDIKLENGVTTANGWPQSVPGYDLPPDAERTFAILKATIWDLRPDLQEVAVIAWTMYFFVYMISTPDDQRGGIDMWSVNNRVSFINKPLPRDFPTLWHYDNTPTPMRQALLDMPIQQYVAK